jgi:hypothetical protein
MIRTSKWLTQYLANISSYPWQLFRAPYPFRILFYIYTPLLASGHREPMPPILYPMGHPLLRNQRGWEKHWSSPKGWGRSNPSPPACFATPHCLATFVAMLPPASQPEGMGEVFHNIKAIRDGWIKAAPHPHHPPTKGRGDGGLVQLVSLPKGVCEARQD